MLALHISMNRRTTKPAAPASRTSPARVAAPARGNCGQGSNWIHRATRLAIYDRDGCACVYCGRKVRSGRGTNGSRAAHLDHVLPVALGGSNAPSNLVTACKGCNDRKGASPVKVFVATLPAGCAARVRAAVATELDRAEGRRLAKLGR